MLNPKANIMLHRIFKLSFVVLILSSFVISSCQKESAVQTFESEPIKEITPTNDIVDVMDDGTVALFEPSTIELEGEGPTPKSGRKWKRRLAKCFNLVFPLTLQLPDSTFVVAEDLAMMRTIAHTWRTNNPDSRARPRIVFPYKVQLPNDEIITIEDLMDLASVVFRCTNRFKVPYPRLRCFRLVFPVTVVFPDGTEKEVDAEDAYRRAIHRWLYGRPTGADSISIKYPFSIALNDETVITVENLDELKEVIEKCRDFVAKRRCFTVTFPLTVEFPGGRKLRVKDREHFLNAVNLWLDHNPNARFRPRIVFPFTVKFEDGKKAILKNRIDYLRAVRKCRGDNNPDDSEE